MFKQLIPLMYWPAAVAMIDDDPGFINTTSRLFSRHKIFDFSEPQSGVDFINQHKIFVAPEKESDFNPEDEPHEFITHYNLVGIHEKLFKPERHDEIALLIIDFKMPQGDGLHFINQLTNSNVKKILLTGVADENVAIEAFNDGKINRYIKKLSEGMDAQLKSYSKELLADYFCDASLVLLDAFPDLGKLLRNSKVIEFFNDFVNEHKIKEFYIVEETGTFLMVDAEDKKFLLCLQTPQAAEDVLADIRFNESASEEELQPLINGQKLTTFMIENLSQVKNPDFKLADVLYDRHTIPGSDVCYAIVPDVGILDLAKDKS